MSPKRKAVAASKTGGAGQKAKAKAKVAPPKKPAPPADKAAGKSGARTAPKARPAPAEPVAKASSAKQGAGRQASPALRSGKGTTAKGPSFPSGLPGTVRQNEQLSRHSTFRIGGPARWHFQPGHADAVAEAVAWAKREGIPWLVLGLGSNVLIRDGGFPGLVLKIGKGLDTLVNKGDVWTAGAGLPTPLLARRSAEAGFAGVQRLIGVPGTVGGGVFMNAGCHSQEFSAVVVSARLLNPAGEMVDVPRARIPFSYRQSGLAGNVVLGCTMKLKETRPASVKVDYQLYLKKRREGTPFDQPCCGSVFKNPEGTTAGKLIDRCGLKGRRVGAARISEQHANYIVNGGGATSDDVLKLIDVTRTAVFKEYGVELELEVQVIGNPA